MRPETRLFLAFLSQTINDASSNSDDCRKERRAAISFLTDTTGGYARRRQEVCDLVNLCPNRLRAGFLKFQQSGMTVKQLLQELANAEQKAKVRQRVAGKRRSKFSGIGGAAVANRAAKELRNGLKSVCLRSSRTLAELPD